MEPRVHALEVRRRLMNPPGGKLSTELDICSPSSRKASDRRKFDIEQRAKQVAARAAAEEARKLRIAQVIEEARIRAEAHEATRNAASAEVIPTIPKLKTIIEVVARNYHTTPIEIISDRREACIVLPRHVAMYLAKNLTLLSLSQIGRTMGGKDHTSVMHAVRKIYNLVENSPQMAATIEALRRELMGAA